MGISNTQYRDIMFQYDQTRMKNQRLLDIRHENLYKKIPELKEIHDRIIELSVEQAKTELLNPEAAATAKDKYTEQKDALLSRKAEILEASSYPADYLSPIFTCSDCRDTGFIGSKPCHCFHRAKIHALYENSNLNEILEKENFTTFSDKYYDDTTIHDNLSITPRENIRRIREICLDFIKHFDDNYDNLLFYEADRGWKDFSHPLHCQRAFRQCTYCCLLDFFTAF